MVRSSRSAPAVLVTGAASGIGRAVALQLAESQHRLALLDRDQAGLHAVGEQAREVGAAQVVTVPTEMADGAAVAAALETTATEFGTLGGLVSAAGILEPAGLTEVTLDSWNRHLDVNTTGVLHLLQQGAPRLRDGAAVVVVSSNAARVPRLGMLAYAASKAATSALTRCAGLELADRGIRCNVVEPGSTDTPMQRDLWPDTALGQAMAVAGDLASYRVGIPLGRLAQATDIAEMVCFLLSDAARHITLQQIFVDGGASL